MFASSYFPKTMFAGRFFPPTGTITIIPNDSYPYPLLRRVFRR